MATDKERLDWLSKLANNGCRIHRPKTTKNRRRIWGVSEEPYGDCVQWSKNLRGAIDKAMKLHGKAIKP